MDIDKAFELTAKQLENEMQTVRALINHAGMKGAATEETVKKFLQKYIPDNLGITSGILVDSEGRVSRQLDIIIFDKAKTPTLPLFAGVSIIPIECAYVVIEVKMFLSSQEMDQCFLNMESVKSLVRKAYYDPGVITRPVQAYGGEYAYWPVIYLVFAFESASSKIIVSKLVDYNKSTTIDKRIDSIFCLDNGFILNGNDKGVLDLLPNESTKYVVSKDKSLLLFYGTLTHYLNQAHIYNVRFLDYLKKINFSISRVEEEK